MHCKPNDFGTNPQNRRYNATTYESRRGETRAGEEAFYSTHTHGDMYINRGMWPRVFGRPHFPATYFTNG